MPRAPGLRRKRYLAGLTQEQLAKQAGVQRLTIIRLERNEDGHISTIKRLADTLGVKLEALMGSEPE